MARLWTLAAFVFFGYSLTAMKADIHPTQQTVIFEDTTSGARFLIGSTIKTDKTAKWEDGKEYPLVQIEISSASHPFYTGKDTTIDTAGRVDKFRKRQEAAQTKTKAKAKPVTKKK